MSKDMKTNSKVLIAIYLSMVCVIVWAYVTEPKKKQEIYKGACGVMLLTTIAVVIDKEDENE